jgi:predicted N-acetyltransferase YhbS
VGIVIRGVSYDEEPAVHAMTAEGFGFEDREWFRRSSEADPWHAPELHRVCEVDGKIVSAVRIVRRWVRYGESVLELGGIGDVTTLPAYRGRGYSTMVLRDALEWMRAHHCDFSLLFTGIPDFYRRVGYETIARRRDVFPLEKAPPPAPGSQVDELDESVHLSGLMRLHETAARGRVGPMLRSPTYWRERLARRQEAHRLLVGTQLGRVTAYAICELGENALLLECGHEPDRFGDLCAVLANAVHTARAKGAGELHAWTGGQAHVRALLRSWLGDGRVEWEHPMARIVNVAQLFSRVQDELQKRLVARGAPPPAAAVSLDTEGYVVGLIMQGDMLRIQPGRRCEQHVALEHKHLLELLFCGGAPALAERFSGLSEQAQALLTALFPPQEFAYSRLDGF